MLLYSGWFGWCPHEFPIRRIASSKEKVGVFSRDVKRETSTEVNFSKPTTLSQNSAEVFPGSSVLTLSLRG